MSEQSIIVLLTGTLVCPDTIEDPTPRTRQNKWKRNMLLSIDGNQNNLGPRGSEDASDAEEKRKCMHGGAHGNRNSRQLQGNL
jgi:hypothetical protein